MTTTTYVLEDQSTYTDEAHGGPLTPEILASIAWAAQWCLFGAADQSTGVTVRPAHTICGQYGGQARVRVGTPNAALAPNEVAVIIRDQYPSQPGAGGWHEDDLGRPAIFVSRQYSSSLTKGPFSLSELVTHECDETQADLGANRFADRLDGTEEALEPGDRVEADVVTAPNGVDVSNFLLEPAFRPGASGPYDLKGTLTGQYDKTPDGYAILRSVGSGLPNQVRIDGTPKHPAQLERIAWPGSRTARRHHRHHVVPSTLPP